MPDHISVQPVVCPDCGHDSATFEASGPDYEDHCCGDQVFTLVRCNNCTTYYLNPRPTPDTLPIIYPAEEYAAYTWNNPIVQWARRSRDGGKVKQTLSFVKESIDKLRVLDIGTGDGSLLEAFRLAGIPGMQLYGMEINPKSVEHLKNQGFQGVLGHAEDLTQIEDASLDVVTMTQVIEHVANPNDVVKDIHRVLKPGGVFLIETPNMDCWDRPLFRKRTWGSYHFPRHWTLWTPDTMKRLLNRSGFEVIHLSTFVAAITWVWSFNHWLQDKNAPKWMLRFFALNNPLALGVFWFLEIIPAMMGRTANMRVIARRRS